MTYPTAGLQAASFAGRFLAGGGQDSGGYSSRYSVSRYSLRRWEDTRSRVLVSLGHESDCY